MENNERLKILNEYNKKNESEEIDLKKKLEFIQDTPSDDEKCDNEYYKFLVENNYVTLKDNSDDRRLFILTKNEYFILEHLYKNEERPLGINEICYDLGFEEKEARENIDNLIFKKLLKETLPVEREIFYYRPKLGTVYLGRELNEYMEMQYFLNLSTVRNNRFKNSKGETKEELKNKKKKLEKKLKIINCFLKISLVIEIIIFVLFFKYEIAFKIALILLVLSIYFKLDNRDIKELENINFKMEEIDYELELRRLTATNDERRAEQLFRVNQIELSRYYNQILSQSKIIFNWGIGCLIFGMGLIISSALIIGFKSKLNLSLDEPKIIAILSGIGGLFSNIIGAYYMNMYNKTMESLNAFHNRFVATHHLHFGNLILSKIKEQNTREKAYSSIFKDIISSIDKTDNSIK